jgi:hypothetical protein
MTEYSLVQAVVVRAFTGNVTANGVTVEGLVNNPLTKGFFNGQINSRYTGDPMNNNPPGTGAVTPDFTTNEVARNQLVDHLVKFFGAPGALECTAQGFPLYDGVTNMRAVHLNMNVTQAIFSAFNTQVVNSFLSYGAASADATALQGVLASFGRQNAAANEICTQPDCTCVTGVVCPSSSSSSTGDDGAASAQAAMSSVTIVVAGILAVLAARE